MGYLLLFSYEVMSDSYNTTDYSLPGSSVHGISQAGILEWVGISFSRGLSGPRNRTHISFIGGGFFTTELPGESHNGILFSHKKEWINAICNNIDEPRDCHTEWNKSDRERQILYDVTYMWNLKQWYKWSYLQNRNRATNVKSKLIVIGGERGGINWELETDIYTLLHIK